MKTPLFIREMTSAERQHLQEGLRAREAFTLRRCQILLASDSGKRPSEIARDLGCSRATVRNAIHAFHTEGIACLEPNPPGPQNKQPILNEAVCAQLKAWLHESPRRFGKPESIWSLKLLAEVAWEQGLTPHQLSYETVRQALRRLGIGWKRAKHWITSPDPAYARKKTRAIA